MSDRVKLNNDFYWDTLQLADDLYDEAKLEEAEELYKKIAGPDDLTGDANSHLFQLLLDMGKYEESLEYYGYVRSCSDTSPAEGAYVAMATELRNPESKLYMYFDEESFYYDALVFISEDYAHPYDTDEDGDCDEVEPGELYLKKNIKTILLTRSKSEDEEIAKDAKYQLLWLYLNGTYCVGDFAVPNPDAKDIDKAINASVVYAEHPDTIDELFCDCSYFLTAINDIYDQYPNSANDYVKRFVIKVLNRAEELGNALEVFNKLESELSRYFCSEMNGYPFYLGYIPKGLRRVPTMSYAGGQWGDNEEQKSIVIPDTITTICDMAFNSCSVLTSVVIPASVTSIGASAFLVCYSLTDITVDENNDNYKSIDGNLYSKDGKELIKYASGKEDELFVIPDGVECIKEDAFDGCLTTSIVVPKSLASIEAFAFSDCNDLESIFYCGSADDYESIEIDWENDCFDEATKYYHSEKQPTDDGDFWHYVNGVPTVW